MNTAGDRESRAAGDREASRDARDRRDPRTGVAAVRVSRSGCGRGSDPRRLHQHRAQHRCASTSCESASRARVSIRRERSRSSSRSCTSARAARRSACGCTVRPLRTHFGESVLDRRDESLELAVGRRRNHAVGLPRYSQLYRATLHRRAGYHSGRPARASLTYFERENLRRDFRRGSTS